MQPRGSREDAKIRPKERQPRGSREEVERQTLPQPSVPPSQSFSATLLRDPSPRPFSATLLDDPSPRPFSTTLSTTLLLQAGADPNVQTYPESDSEYRSGQWGRTLADGTKEILSAQSDCSSLHIALGYDDPSEEMVRLLLKHGADPNLRDMQSRTALHMALDFEEERGGVQLPLAELLLQHKAPARQAAGARPTRDEPRPRPVVD